MPDPGEKMANGWGTTLGARRRTDAVEPAWAANGHFAIDADRRIVEWDDAMARLLGMSREEALGTSCNCAIGGKNDFGRDVCGSACAALRRLAAGNVAGTSRLLVRRIDGQRLRLACDLTTLPSGGALGRLHPADDAGPDLAHDLAGIAALATRVSEEPLQQGLRLTLDFLLHATAADAGEAFLAEPHGRGMVRTCHRGCFGRVFDELLRFDPGEGFPGLVLSHGRPVYTEHLPQDARFLRTHVKQEGFSTYVCSPLSSRSDTLGCLALAFRRSDIDLERVLNLLRWAGTPMGLAADTALARLRDAAGTPLQGAGDDPWRRLPQALRAVLQQMVRTSRADGGELYLPWPDLEVRALVPDAAAVPRCPTMSAGTIRRCPGFDTGTSTLLHGRRVSWPAACRGAPRPGGAWCCIPMSCEGESLGMIRLRYRRLRPSPPHENIAPLEGIASLAAEKLRELRGRIARTPRADTALHEWLQRAVEVPGTGTPARAPRRALPVPGGARCDGARLEIRCFARLELMVEGARVAPAAIRRKRVLTLLGILLTHHDQPQSRDALIEMLWPGADPQVRSGQFHVLVHELRRLLDPAGRANEHPYVRNRADRYAFDTQSPCWIDTLEFRTLLELGRKAEAANELQAAIGAYESAADLYRGDYLQDEPFAQWCWQTREQLREACLGMLNRLTALSGRLGHWEKSAAWSRRALLLDPLREEMHRALMYALWAAGRRDEAARQYEACAHLLREQLDLAPLPETEQLFARIRAAPRPDAGH
ncbi:MAG: GAF domain-containing protein [Burkholderiales bacterium]|nr:GAF domain-containing protein [Burkholderiales bacterium]